MMLQFINYHQFYLNSNCFLFEYYRCLKCFFKKQFLLDYYYQMTLQVRLQFIHFHQFYLYCNYFSIHFVIIINFIKKIFNCYFIIIIIFNFINLTNGLNFINFQFQRLIHQIDHNF